MNDEELKVYVIDLVDRMVADFEEIKVSARTIYDLDAVQCGKEVLEAEIAALVKMTNVLGAEFARASSIIAGAKGRVIVSGMGKSGHIGKKIAATLASTGTPSFFVHPSEASHGDLGMITRGDVCILISNSGETTELHGLLTYISRFLIPLIAITRSAESTLARHADLTLLLPDAPEACSIGMAPTTSTTCTLALGDAIAVTVMRMRGFAREDFHVFHPGGSLGAKLLRVRDVMHVGDKLPLVRVDQPMGEVLVEMSAKGFGVAGVVSPDGTLAGIVTDGDLRRNLHRLMECTALETATIQPVAAEPDMLLVEALGLMNSSKVTALPVLDDGNRFVGLVHVHDCLRAGVA